MNEQLETERIAKLITDYNRAMKNIQLAFKNGWIKTEITQLPSTPNDDCVRYAVSLVPKRKIRIL